MSVCEIFVHVQCMPAPGTKLMLVSVSNLYAPICCLIWMQDYIVRTCTCMYM